jgi:hypothetical protein
MGSNRWFMSRVRGAEALLWEAFVPLRSQLTVAMRACSALVFAPLLATERAAGGWYVGRICKVPLCGALRDDRHEKLLGLATSTCVAACLVCMPHLVARAHSPAISSGPGLVYVHFWALATLHDDGALLWYVCMRIMHRCPHGCE